MPRRSVLTSAERLSVVAIPATDDELIRHYTLSEADVAVIHQHRGGHNRLGFAVQLCSLRHPGSALTTENAPPPALLSFVAHQLRLDPALWAHYAQRAETRREHLVELHAWLGLTPFGVQHFRQGVHQLTDLAAQTDRGIVLAMALVDALRQQRVVLPPVEVIERICAEALTRGTRRVYAALAAPLSADHCALLDGLLAPRAEGGVSMLVWLRQPPGVANAKHLLAHIARLHAIRALALPEGLDRVVHQNRLLKLAREGGQMTAQHLRELEPTRRSATLVAVAFDTRATLIDEIIDLHDRLLGMQFNRAKRAHAERFQQSGKAINDKVRLYSRIGRALLDAKQTGVDPFVAIEAILPWEAFQQSVTEAEQMAQPEEFDYLPLLRDSFTPLRRYTPALLDALALTAAPAARDLLAGVETLKTMDRQQARKVPISRSRIQAKPVQ